MRGGKGKVGFATTHLQTTLTFDVDLAAEGLDALEVIHRGNRYRGVSLRWATERGRFERGAKVAGRIVPRDRHRIIFHLLGHPAWTGRIRQLALTVRMGRNRRFSIEDLRGLRRSAGIGPEEIRERLERAWQVDLAAEWRSVRIVGTDQPIPWTLEIPEGACLDFGYGAIGPRIGTVHYEVRAVLESGGSTTQSGGIRASGRARPPPSGPTCCS